MIQFRPGAFENTELVDLKNDIVNKLFVYFFCIWIVIYGFVVLRFLHSGGNSAFVVQSILIPFFSIATLLRKRLSLFAKVSIFSLIVAVVLASGLQQFGYLASGKYYVVMVPIFISFVFSLEYAIAIQLFYIAIYVVFAILFHTGFLRYDFNMEAYVRSINSWLLDFTVMFLTSLGLMYVLYKLTSTLSGSYRRIEEQHRELSQNEKKYRVLFETSNDAILLLKEDLFWDCNKNALQMFCCSREFLLNKPASERSPKYQPDGKLSDVKLGKILEAAYGGESQVFDWEHINANGEHFFVSVGLNPLVLDDGIYVQAVLRDITQKKIMERELESYKNNLEKLVDEKTHNYDLAIEELEATNEELQSKNTMLNNALTELKNTQLQLIQAEKMASLGVLVTGVAHEINNPLNYVVAGLYSMQEYYKSKPDDFKNIQTYLGFIEEGVSKASAIVKTLGQFNAQSEAAKEECSIHDVIENCLMMMKSKLPVGVIVEKHYCSDSLSLTCQPGRMHQLFINIIANAIDAIPNSGTITIATCLDRTNAIITISDTGVGMEPETMRRAIDPFFTTKDAGMGIGLGLFVANSIAREFGGELSIDSIAGVGTTIRLDIPLILDNTDS